MKKLKENKGFTLVELIVVIAILGILAAVAVPAYSGYIDKANEAADITVLDAVKTAAMATYAQEGEVKAIVVTASNGSASDVYVKVGTSESYAKIADTNKTNFETYFGSAATSIKFDSDKFAKGAEWTGSSWDKQTTTISNSTNTGGEGTT